MPNELLDQKFVDIMFENMWQYINPDTITFIMSKLGLNIKCFTSNKSINDDIWDREKDKSCIGNICFKGNTEEGHYVFVDEKLKAWGSYEQNILLKDDDGMCHGVAMVFAISKTLKTHKEYEDILDFRLKITVPTKSNTITYRKKLKLYLVNYINVLSFYKYILETGIWDKALKKFFDIKKKGGKFTEYSQVALRTVNIKIDQLMLMLDPKYKKISI